MQGFNCSNNPHERTLIQRKKVEILSFVPLKVKDSSLPCKL